METLAGMGGVTVERNVPLTMADGTTLYSDIYRPAGEGPFPVILIRLPYDKNQGENITYAHPAWYARHGYVVVSQDVRGRYRSEGEWYPFLNEASDGVATIEWAAQLPGTTGQVGMYGFSYAGATQLLPAVERPKGLAALCPGMTATQYYEGWTYNRGAFALGFAASWAMSLGIANAARRGDDAAAGALGAAFSKSRDWDWVLPINIYPPLQGEDTRYYFDWLAHSTYDDYWKRWSIDSDYSRIDVPAMHIAGWYDVFLTGTVRNYQGLRDNAGSGDAKAKQKLVIGPWYHIPWQPLVNGDPIEAAPAFVDDLQIAWFDLHMKGIASDILESPVTIWLMGAEQWIDLADWPPPGVVEQSLFLHSQGRANSRYGDGWLSQESPEDEIADIYTYDPSVPNEIEGGHSCCFPDVAPMGPADQEESESWNQVLVYTSEELEEDILLIGEPYVELYASSSAVDTDWTARLCIVDEDGISVNLQEGIVRAQFRDSLESPTLLEPNRVYQYRIDLGPVGILVPAGHRFRLDISSSDFPQWDRNMNTGNPTGTEGMANAVVATQIVLHDSEHPSRLVLPVVSQL
ncbi:MAG: CocE/NonD family hydrolase [Thermomicrobiales bacterium]|nr:CocE/NonD family hydrolase [Thermomicrobiales bacterium]